MVGSGEEAHIERYSSLRTPTVRVDVAVGNLGGAMSLADLPTEEDGPELGPNDRAAVRRRYWQEGEDARELARLFRTTPEYVVRLVTWIEAPLDPRPLWAWPKEEDDR